MTKFPFTFFNHGELDLDYVNKNEECYIWFDRTVTAEERKIITESCPPPISGLFVWGECFAYFGSGGDTYDFDIVQCYGGEACTVLNKLLSDLGDDFDGSDMESYIEDRSKNYPAIEIDKLDFSDFESGFSELLSICVPRFVEDLEKWANAVNKLVPISFLMGPNNPGTEDEWSRYSYSQIEKSLTAITNYLTNNMWLIQDLASDDDEENEDELFEDGNNYKINVVSKKEQARYFSYIFSGIIGALTTQDEIVELTKESRKERLRLADIIYSIDGVTKPIKRLSDLEHKIQKNDDIILSALKGLSKEKRLEELAHLLPYTQIAYYASYGALKNKDLIHQKNPIELLNDLFKNLPAERKAVKTSLLSMIAHNLIHVSPAYNKPDKKYAKIAAQLFEVISKQNDASETDFITGTVCCEWAKLYDLGVAISELGLAKYTKSKQLLNNAISVANLSGNKNLADKLLSIAEKTIELPDENFILNKTYSLVNSGNNKAAHKVITEYVKNGGKKSPNILVNLCHSYWQYKAPEKKEFDQFIKETGQLIKTKKEYQIVVLIENYLGMLSNYKLCEDTNDFFEYLLDNKIKLSPNCWISYMYAGVYANVNIQNKTVILADKYLIENEKDLTLNPMPFANIVYIYALLGNVEKAIHYLNLCKKYNYSYFKAMQTEQELKSLWELEEFKVLF